MNMLINILTLSEKRVDLLKLMIFPCAIVYIGYFYTDYILNISKNIPNIMIFDKIYEVLNNILKLINLIAYASLLSLICISVIHYIFRRKSISFEDIIYLRHTLFNKVLFFLLESSAWHLISVAFIIIIKNPTKNYIVELLFYNNVFLTFPGLLFVIIWISHWIFGTKLGVDE